ncbi:C1q-related factor-like [Mercenaria mercenaria]|uniref:C1q-related factor-like n=1 Tax=Mercenaria mercenaria TaxID=6596 RepID=UPI00234F8674|nr:C1q-related factor-like [Mercenaria mercenaria]
MDNEYADEGTDIRNNVKDIAKRQKRFQTSTNVAFYVYLSHHPQYNKHETLVFDVEETDTGDNYNANDGIFDVPVTGTYVFTVTVGSLHNGFVTAEIIVNGQVKGTAFANSEHIHDDHSASGTIVVHANAGDHVFVRKGATSDNYPIISDNAYIRTAFCGWLLF